MQQVSFEIFDGCIFHCPATGKKLIADHPFEPSAATLFAYVEEAGEFEFITEELRKKYDSMDAEEDDQFQQFLDGIEDPNVVCFRITHCGMACGPMSITAHIGIRMDHEVSLKH